MSGGRVELCVCQVEELNCVCVSGGRVVCLSGGRVELCVCQVEELNCVCQVEELNCVCQVEELKAQLAACQPPSLESEMLGTKTSARRRTQDEKYREELRRLDKERKEAQEV